jgi:indolepyruvate ferredoxin oxidoreductase
VRTTRVVIDEAVCEGCGDCGAKSNCLSVQPVDTELGRKTRIDQTSCNTDYSCLLGDCPSFLTVEVTGEKPKRARRRAAVLPTSCRPRPRRVPRRHRRHRHRHRQPGARHRLAAQRLATTGLDQVGPVAEGRSRHVAPARRATAARPTACPKGAADVALGFDLLVLADAKNLAVCSPASTVAVVSTSTTPDRHAGVGRLAPRADSGELLAKVRRHVASVFEMDALRASEALFGSTAPANLLLVGAAFQLGALPAAGVRPSRRRWS